jgi:hypothetical protein
MMAGIGPDFPKCPACKKDMESVALSEVPQASVKEMVRYNRYQPLNPAYWYVCRDHDIFVHKLAVKQK